MCFSRSIREQQQLGGDGFEKAVKEIDVIEHKLCFSDLAQSRHPLHLGSDRPSAGAKREERVRQLSSETYRSNASTPDPMR